MEQYIVAENKDISAALVVGAQHFQAALLIEPVDDSKVIGPAERATFIERIWPSIEAANKDAPSHARIMKSHILFTQPQKPFVRAGKGTVSRAASLKSYCERDRCALQRRRQSRSRSPWCNQNAERSS